MIEDITSIKIKGGLFETETDLPIFAKEKPNNPEQNFSLIYGKNGSGKSTISRGFRKITGAEEPQIESMELLDVDGSVIAVSEEEKNYIYVFNEEFIEDNIKIEDDGLNAIVVMGAVKDVDDKIKKIQPDYEKSLAEAQAQQEVFNKYLDIGNDLCPEYYINEMQKALKGDNSWASRDARVHEKKTNSQVRRDTYTQFVGLHPTKNRDELVVVYDTMMKKLEDAKSGSKRIEIAVPTLKTFTNAEIDILNLLKEKIEKPILSEREKSLFHILQENNGNQRLTDIKTYFNGSTSLVQVAIYDNRLEISSPGGLMPGVTIEKMKDGFSKVRNRGIANAFVYMKLIEQWGSGIPKILAQTKEYGLPEVEFIDMESAFRVNMYRALPQDEKQTITTNDKVKRQTTTTNDKNKKQTIKANDKNIPKKTKEYEILKYLSEVDKAKTADIAAFIGLGPDWTRAILASMAKRNMIVAEGANRNRIYRLSQTIK